MVTGRGASCGSSWTSLPVTTSLGSKAIRLVYGVDGRFAVGLAASLSSAVEHLSDGHRLEVFVIDGGLGRTHRQRLMRSFAGRGCEVRWLTPPHRKLSRLKVGGDITVATYFRLLIPELLGREISKVIYLDADVIVHRDLGGLWVTPFTGHPVLAVQDQGVRYISGPYGLSNYRSLGIPEDAKYFNAGVLLLDLEKWRREHISDSVMQYIRDHSEHIRFHDQDGLNAVLWNRWGWLDPRWNQMPQLLQVSRIEDSPFDRLTHERTVRDPYITHFASSDKPWRYGCRHPASADFLSALATTEYRTFRPSRWRDRWADCVHGVRSRLVRLREGLAR
jgi:lipopolysaccharide biosynthesis glycosyltransferase